MKITITTIIERQRARLYSKKANNCRYVFKYKTHTFDVTGFDEIFELSIYIQKHDTLRNVTFLYTKS